MNTLFKKIIIYTFLILVTLEILIRVFHLTKDYPLRFVDKDSVEKWVPNQSGFSVTGNRRQNFSEFNINNSGFNSYREFTPSKDKVEIALVGDSFIEGFHQDYYNSIGKKIERSIDGIEVYEYGYAGYDLADQLHLINSYHDTFNLIDYVVIGLKFEDDLNRSEYKIIKERMRLESPIYKMFRNVKLLVYLQNIGGLDSVRKLFRNLNSNNDTITTEKKDSLKEMERAIQLQKKMDNFQSLIQIYGFDKHRFVFLLDKEKTPNIFLDYLNKHQFKYIDVSSEMKKSIAPTTLIYDQHWNDHGRDIIAKLMVTYFSDIIDY
jgi:hypothetical protein